MPPKEDMMDMEKDMDAYWGDKREKTYLQDFGGAIPTILSIMAGFINMNNYTDGTTDEAWKDAYMTELLWSGIIETGAITAVFITDSNLLRAIGAWSMVGVNATSLYMINRAEDAQSNDSYTKTMILHGIALGMSIVTWGQTYFIDTCGNFMWGAAGKECKEMKDKMKGDMEMWDKDMEGMEDKPPMGEDGDMPPPPEGGPGGPGGPPQL